MTRKSFVLELLKIVELTGNEDSIAEQFEVPPSTVRRWISGVACPPPRVRALIIRDMKEKLENQLKKN